MNKIEKLKQIRKEITALYKEQVKILKDYNTNFDLKSLNNINEKIYQTRQAYKNLQREIYEETGIVYGQHETTIYTS